MYTRPRLNKEEKQMEQQNNEGVHVNLCGYIYIRWKVLFAFGISAISSKSEDKKMIQTRGDIELRERKAQSNATIF